MSRLLCHLLAVSCLLVLEGAPAAAETAEPTPNYVGSEACSQCHAAVTAVWTGSHHAWAWRTPNETTVLGDFDDASIDHKGITTRFSTRGGRYYIETDGPNGELREFEVKYTAGVEPLQQYLLETEPGRLQALDLAWDTARKQWYHLYPDQDLIGGDGLHWTGPYKTWNARCAECHATGFRKNYDPKTRSYASTQAEIGIGCEACHGPGATHIAWARAPEGYDATRWPGLTAKGLTIGFVAQSPEIEIEQCAGCHARREPFLDGNPLPGTAFHDAYRLALLREGLFHADGSIQDEVYVYGSFLQSKMYARGVGCTDCHDPHTANLKADKNAVCTKCHSPAGNLRFSTLRRADYDDPSHHFHVAGTDGARCVSCHMIERVYMGIDGRRDHSFRRPRPDLSLETDAPNACTDCHADRGPSWAADEIARRFPVAGQRGPDFSQVFAAARNNPASGTEALLEIAGQDNRPSIVRASALDLLRAAANESIAGRAAPLLGDADPLVRAAAIGVQRGAPPIERVQRLVPMFEDPIRSVRIAAAREFLDAPVASLPPRIAAAAGKAMQEWRASLLAKADFPETHMALGGAALVTRNTRAAEAAFRETVRLDPQRVEAWTMIVRILAAVGDRDGTRIALNDALVANPSNGFLLSLRDKFKGANGR